MASLIIKVCGMTEAENIRNVEQLDVDMIGFIFYPKSPRCLCEIPAYLPVRAKRVGVFVNESKETILMYAEQRAAPYQGFFHFTVKRPGNRFRLQGIMRLLPL